MASRVLTLRRDDRCRVCEATLPSGTTAKREWSHGRVWQGSRQRDRALSSYLRFYNRQRPHSAAKGRPPITRVHKDREHDT